jgi:hypothetical protein
MIYKVGILRFTLTRTYYYSVISDLDEGDTKRPKARSGTLGNPVAVDDDGLLIDVDVQSVDDDHRATVTRVDKRQDVDHFFLGAVFKDMNGKSKKYRLCKICP